MTSATRKGVGTRRGKTPPTVDVMTDPAFAKYQAAVQAGELNDAAKKIGTNAVAEMLADEAIKGAGKKFKQFADAKKSTGAESGVIVDGAKLPHDMMEACAKLLREHGGGPGPAIIDPDDEMKVGYQQLPVKPYVPYARLREFVKYVAACTLGALLLLIVLLAVR